MKLWLIYQNQNSDYDTYDSAVVAAANKEEAARTFPSGGCKWTDDGKALYDFGGVEFPCSSWATDLSEVIVRYLGEAADGTEAGVVLASFNAG